MLWFKILVGLFLLVILYAAARAVLAYLRFKRHFDDFSVEAGQRLLRHADQVDGTLERWHEYDEAYQEAAARIEEQEEAREQLGRGVTLGPSGGSLRKPN